MYMMSVQSSMVAARNSDRSATGMVRKWNGSLRRNAIMPAIEKM
jgi:hypothetical protein